MKESRFRKVIARREAFVGLMVQEFGARGLARIHEATDVDFVLLDMKHGGRGIEASHLRSAKITGPRAAEERTEDVL